MVSIEASVSLCCTNLLAKATQTSNLRHATLPFGCACSVAMAQNGPNSSLVARDAGNRIAGKGLQGSRPDSLEVGQCCNKGQN